MRLFRVFLEHPSYKVKYLTKMCFLSKQRHVQAAMQPQVFKRPTCPRTKPATKMVNAPSIRARMVMNMVPGICRECAKTGPGQGPHQYVQVWNNIYLSQKVE